MKNLIDYICGSNEPQSTSKDVLIESQSEQVLLVLHCVNVDGIRTDYYFWTSLPEEVTQITNSKYIKDEFKTILQKKAPKAWKAVEEVLEHVNSRDTEVHVWTERIKTNKIKKL